MNAESPLDLLVLGSGVAGLTAAVGAATRGNLSIGVVTKGGLEQSTTRFAQGGVAAALSLDPEDVDLHLSDTLSAGAGLCDVDAVRVLVDEGPRRVEELISLGAEFDRDTAGNLELAREGGHSVARIVHAGGAATGAEVERALVNAVRRSAVILLEDTFVVDLILDDGRCVGVECLSRDGIRHEVRARNVLMAAGGAGQLFSVTTNPAAATGDGVAMAMRAGAAAADLEFFQFHPTALHHTRKPRPLLSEALRGHGAVLRDSRGERFVDELLPRDVVSRAIMTKILSEGTDHVNLDCRELKHFSTRFPSLASVLESVGLDAEKDLLPVAPAAHHLCGGILTDLDGATSVPGLWAAGEVACAGVHGANRLASNSLLEGMVFAPRAVEAIIVGKQRCEMTGAMSAIDPAVTNGPVGLASSMSIPGRVLEVPPVAEGDRIHGLGPETVRARLGETMMAMAGVVRTQESLREAISVLDELARTIEPISDITVGLSELDNLVQLSRDLVVSALNREESRGTHFRLDHPEPVEELRERMVHLGSHGRIAP